MTKQATNNLTEQMAAKINAVIRDADVIIIHRHQRPDPDAIGSQTGLKELILTNYPNKRVYCVGSNVAGLSWIGTSDEIEDKTYQNAVVIVVDTANQPRVDDERYTLGKQLIKIDHHPDDDHFGDVSWVNQKASSCSEMMTQLAATLGWKISAAAAKALYAGIVGDTGRFMYPNTTPTTFAMTSKLLATGIKQANINQRLANISLPVARLSAYVYENFKLTENNAAWIVLDHDTLATFELGDAGTSAVVPLLGQIDVVKCWCVFVQQKDGSYRLRIRSKHAAINELAKQYGGGGHPLASGAFMPDGNKIKQFIAQLDEIAKNDAN